MQHDAASEISDFLGSLEVQPDWFGRLVGQTPKVTTGLLYSL